MDELDPRIAVVRHGATAWSVSGRHTGRKDLALTPAGEVEARAVGPRLRAMGFERARVSPLQRALRTSELAGFAGAEVDPDLQEWDYGSYEGLIREEILAHRPGWDLFRDGCPGGESPADVARRADAVAARLRGSSGSVVLFAHGHFLRVLAVRWLDLPVTMARNLMLETGTIGIFGVDRDGGAQVLARWNSY